MADGITIGEMASRAGVATSALRFYEKKGLIWSERTEGNQRRYERSMLRRVSVIKAAQALGITLETAKEALDRLPRHRTPTATDWAEISTAWRSDVEERITRLERMRDELSSCIGCGCLSLETCGLFNAEDAASSLGTGARYLLSDDRPY